MRNLQSPVSNFRSEISDLKSEISHPGSHGRPSLRDRLGLCQWFHYENHAALERTVELLHELGVKLLRTGISWADFHRPGGKAWYDRQMHARHEFEVLLSIWHTPMSLAEGPRCAAPPRRLRDFADFIAQVIDEYGDCFAQLELWSEPNNRLKWDFRNYDPQWEKFARMIHDAAYWARRVAASPSSAG